MKCPKCGSENVTIDREQAGVNGSGFGGGGGNIHNALFGGVNASGMNFTSGSAKIKRKTVALCHDCGYAWQIKSEEDEKEELNNKNTAIGCLTLIIVSLFVMWAVGSCSGSSSKSNTTAKSSPAVTAEPTAQWSETVTPLSDFAYEVQNGTIVLQDYNGGSDALQIAHSYEVQGKAMPVSLADLYLKGGVKTLIFADGTENANVAIMNGNHVEKLYIPASMQVVYDYMLGYVDDYLKEIDYGGSEEQWNTVYQTYQPGDGESDAYKAGAEFAYKINKAVGTTEVSLDGVTMNYNVSIADLYK